MILCCGEALIDMIPTGTSNGDRGFNPCSGGAVFNTAIALGRLGINTGFLSGLSSDLFGQQLRATLAASQVNTNLAVTSDRPTTLAFVQLSDGHASYTFYDENTAGRMLSADQLPDLTKDITALFFGGISLCTEPCGETYETLSARANGRAIMLDPNIRTGFIENPDSFRARLTRMFARADIVKVSDEDLDWLFPEPQSAEDKAETLRGMGPSIIILTKGSKGAAAFFGTGQMVEIDVKPVKVADTVGAGDTFNAGVLTSLSDQGLLTKSALGQISAPDISAALTFGARVAAITVTRAGANPPWRAEIDRRERDT